MSTRPEVPIAAFLESFQEEITVMHKEWQVILRKESALDEPQSRIGKYIFDWHAKVLMDPSFKPVAILNSKELHMLEKFLLANRKEKISYYKKSDFIKICKSLQMNCSSSEQ